jgi:2-amino-4-hydroxy-6-hydroxymethyldihydropteridine diphosphokinase
MIDNIFLGLGSNKGDRLKYLQQAAKEISFQDKCRVTKYSSIYETTPIGNAVQNNYYNAVIEIETVLGAYDLFFFLKSIEAKLGRDAIFEKWGPREIDIDLLFYNSLTYDNNQLTLPHPEILNRDFVIIPLLEIAPNFVHPVLKKPFDEIDLAFEETHIVQKLDFTLV